MLPGEIRLKWDERGELDIRCSLPVVTSENKKLAVRILLDAARAINDLGTALEVPVGIAAPTRILGGA